MKTYQSPSGYTVYMGNSAHDNDYLCNHILSGSDWWFHVRGSPGPHIIMKVAKHIPDELVQADDVSFCKALAMSKLKAKAKKFDVIAVRGIDVEVLPYERKGRVYIQR